MYYQKWCIEIQPVATLTVFYTLSFRSEPESSEEEKTDKKLSVSSGEDSLLCALPIGPITRTGLKLENDYNHRMSNFMFTVMLTF